MHVLVGDRRDKHDPRRGFAVERLRLQTGDVLGQLAAKVLQARLPRERFVESERGEDHVGFLVREMLLGVGKVGRPRLHVNRVGRPSEMSHDKFMLRELLLQQRLEVPELLRALEQRVADQRDAVSLLQRQRQARSQSAAPCAGRGAVFS